MKENVIQINGGIMINVDVNVKNVMYGRKNYVWNPATCIYVNGKYLASIMDDSAIICDTVIDADVKLSPKDDGEIKAIPTNFNEKKVTCKMQKFYILLAFLKLLQHY